MEIFSVEWHQQLQIVIHVVIATLLGAVIGMERELSNRPAGLRTHAILAAAAAMLMGLADVIVIQSAQLAAEDNIQADPIRVVEAIATGVAFLGAGTIFRNREEHAIEGLTTAASLLFVSAVAVAVSLGQVLLAVAATGMGFVVLRLSRWWSGAHRENANTTKES